MRRPTQEQIRALYDQVCRCSSPEEIFGELSGSDTATQLASLRAAHRELVKTHHPDRYHEAPPLVRYMVAEITSALNAWHERARAKLEADRYGEPEPSAPREHAFEIRTRTRTYRVIEHLVEGDCANIYHAHYDREDGGIEQACLKVALSEDDNDLIRNEIRVLERVQHKSLPVYLDAFKTTDGQMAAVLRYIDGVDLVSVRDARPDGLDQEHVAWILERLLSVLGFLHANQVIHGNIEPANIMIRPRDHNAFLIDFVFAIIDPMATGAGFKGFSEGYSAPEVRQRKSPIPPSDLYSLGKSMLQLLGGDIETDRFPPSIDHRLRRFLMQFLLPNPMHRARDAWELWHELRGLRREVFPGRRFVPLEL